MASSVSRLPHLAESDQPVQECLRRSECADGCSACRQGEGGGAAGVLKVPTAAVLAERQTVGSGQGP
ncbi:hypothetical protein ACFRCI_18250 [Streptomyces sp. NPDC056638]|uniref:hypothetical protein n=1 Tax=Streptomyces sp. NPDC056638 TaxID=3345887 RepID=UPI0036A75C3B